MYGSIRFPSVSRTDTGPYHYDVVRGLVEAAKKNNIAYATDVYPFYGSDADAALSAGTDARTV